MTRKGLLLVEGASEARPRLEADRCLAQTSGRYFIVQVIENNYS
jgi:hypothetical protein